MDIWVLYYTRIAQERSECLDIGTVYVSRHFGRIELFIIYSIAINFHKR
jgi:hypothetical protein